MNIYSKAKELHEKGYHVELKFTWLKVSKKDTPVYIVTLYKDFTRTVGVSENSIEEAFEKAWNQRGESKQ